MYIHIPQGPAPGRALGPGPLPGPGQGQGPQGSGPGPRARPGARPWGICMYIYVCICTCAYVYVNVYIHIYTYTYTYIHVHVHTYMYILGDTFKGVFQKGVNENWKMRIKLASPWQDASTKGWSPTLEPPGTRGTLNKDSWSQFDDIRLNLDFSISIISIWD